MSVGRSAPKVVVVGGGYGGATAAKYIRKWSDGRIEVTLVEREGRRSIVGNIYKGVVTNVLPGMQAAFVDIGLAKDAFLYAGDYTAKRGEEEGADPEADEDEDAADLDVGEVESEPRVHVPAPPIEELLRREHGVSKIIRYDKKAAALPIPDEMLAAATSECDVVINGIAD